MKNKLKKAISALLASVMVMSSGGNVVFANEVDNNSANDETAAIDTIPDSVVSDDAIVMEETGVSAYSFLPLKEVEAEIDLTKMLPVELGNMKISDFLSRMIDTSTGEPIKIKDSDTTVWADFYDKSGHVSYNEWKKIDINETINLRDPYSYIQYIYDNSSEENLEMIVGSGKQLDPNNTRYLVTIKYPTIDDIYSFNIGYQYNEKDTNGNETGRVLRKTLYSSAADDYRILTDKNGDFLFDEDGNPIVVPEIDLYVSSTQVLREDYYLSLSTKGNSNYLYWRTQNVDIEIYDGQYYSPEEAEEAASIDPQVNITAQILDADMDALNAGYIANWIAEDGKMLTFVFKRNGEVVGSENVILKIVQYNNQVNVNTIYGLNDNNQMVYIYNNYDRDIGYLHNDPSKPIKTETYYLYEEYPANEQYYVTMSYFFDGERYNDRVTKAVVGFYDSIAEAESQPDIKDQLFATHRKDGYKACFGGSGVNFTVFVDKEVYYLTVKAENTNVLSDNTYVSFYDLYNKDSNDSEGFKILDTYKVSSYDMDSYAYLFNYITFLVFDIDADMSSIIPGVYKHDNCRIYCEGDLEEPIGEYWGDILLSPRDFTKIPTDLNENPRNSVRYTVTAENEKDQENYVVTAVKREENGPKLFVNGPDKREVILDSYYGKYHDILIANIGTEELKNIKVDLDATNVKIDDYWTIGGDGNNTLAPFETTKVNYSYNSSEELQNLAKVRLVPDGDGTIKGKLTITADGQQPRVITLEGYAGDPKIDTTSLKDGVKYVPYQSIVTTNNKYSWNRVEFSLAGGRLPKGIELKPDGEIYGTPKETGSFPITVKATFSNNRVNFKPSTATLTLNIKDNTDDNVNEETDIEDGFAITDRIENIDIYEGDPDKDQTFEFEYDYAEHEDEFQDFWLDGEKLTKDVDYTVESGSTKITVRSQTFSNAGNGSHTIAAEYRNTSNQVKKAAQNYSRNTKEKPNGGGSGGSSGGSGGSSGGGGGGGNSVKTTYTVSYESNGGSAVQSQNVVKGQKISFLATPKKPGYKFVGWYTDEELTNKFDETKAITASIKLYAKYEQVECTVWFDSNGGTEAASVKLMGDTALETLPATTKDSYEFVGWFTEDGKQFNAGDKIYTNTTLIAKWNIIIPDEAPDEASGFYDVNANAWYYDDVNWAFHANLMVGYNNAIFAPDNKMVLSNIVTVLAKLSGDDFTKYNNSSAVEGITEGMWYTPYAKWAKSKGIVDNFSPDAQLSREDMAVILDKFINYIKTDFNTDNTEVNFADNELISANAKAPIQRLYNLGVIAGRGNNVIDPQGLTTRAEFAALIHRMNSKILN